MPIASTPIADFSISASDDFQYEKEGRYVCWAVTSWVVAVAVAVGLVFPTATNAQSGSSEILLLENIERAVSRAIDRIYTDAEFEPAYTIERLNALSDSQPKRHMTGNQSLLLWSMLAAGESYQNPRLYKRLNWVLSRDPFYTFDRGMRAQMLAELPFERWRPWINRDRIWLGAAVTRGDISEAPALQGSFAYEWNGEETTGFGDHANAQYGVLGLAGIERSGLTVDREIWKRIDAHWRASQARTPGLSAAGWAGGPLGPIRKQDPNLVSTTRSRVSGPMTAGGVATLTLTERALFGDKMLTPGDNVSANLKKGLAWLDEKFNLRDKSEETDWFFYMWTIQQVGQATGYRTFNGVDWYRDATAEILKRQQSDGTWVGPKGKVLSTGFALLFLGRADDPVAVSKVRFGQGAQGWHNRPHDVWNLVDYFTDQYEYATTWQIVELDQNPGSLIESPILYFATDQKFELTASQLKNLHGYLDAGGMLVTNADADKQDANASFRKLFEKLYPGLELADVPRQDVPKQDGLYGLHQRVGPDVSMMQVHNGVRPVIVHFKRDIGRALQANDQNRSSAFKAFSNLYLYATGMNPRRARFENDYIVQTRKNTSKFISAARIKHDGRFDPEPNALRQLKAILANEHRLGLEHDPAGVEAASLDGSDAKVAFLTTSGDGTLSDAEAKAIKRWVDGGGTLVLDATGGSAQAVDSARKMLATIMGRTAGDDGGDTGALPISISHPILSGVGLGRGGLGRGGHDLRRVRYRPYVLGQIGPINTARLQAVFIGDRPAIIYSEEDLTAGLAGLQHWKIFGYSVKSARELVENIMLFVDRR